MAKRKPGRPKGAKNKPKPENSDYYATIVGKSVMAGFTVEEAQKLADYLTK